MQYIASYRPTQNEPNGRLYATSFTAQKLSRDFRLVLFHDHFEIDLTIAHLNLLLLDRAPKEEVPFSIQELVATITTLLKNTAFSRKHANPLKRLIYKLLNTSAAETITDLYATDVVLQPELPALIRTIDRLKRNFVEEHSATRGQQGHHNDRNSFFFLITEQEKLLIQDLLQELSMRMNIQSIIWLHDGIWILPPPEVSVLQQVTRLILPNTPSPEELFKTTPVRNYLHDDQTLLKIHQQLQEIAQNASLQQKDKDWKRELIQDATTRTTRAKQIRDLTWHHKQATTRTTDRPPTKTIQDFFIKKGLQ